MQITVYMKKKKNKIRERQKKKTTPENCKNPDNINNYCCMID